MARSSEDRTPGAEPTPDPRSAAPAPSRAPEDPNAPAGRIVHDERGNAVWNWSNGNSRIAIGSTSQMLKQLDLTNLRVEDDAPPGKEAGVKPRGSGYGPGYDPYDRRAPVRVTPVTKGPKR
jgi:hypothetical protein